MIAPVVIEPDALYDDSAVYQTTGITENALAAGRRSGRLRYCRMGRRTLYRGSWLLAWVDSSSVMEEAKD